MAGFGPSLANWLDPPVNVHTYLLARIYVRDGKADRRKAVYRDRRFCANLLLGKTQGEAEETWMTSLEARHSIQLAAFLLSKA